MNASKLKTMPLLKASWPLGIFPAHPNHRTLTGATLFLCVLFICIFVLPTIAFSDLNKSTDPSNVKTKTLDVGDPISANSGAYHFSMPLFDLGGPLPLRYVLDYRMDWDEQWDFEIRGLFGPFESNLNVFLFDWETTGECVYLLLRNGEIARFDKNTATDQWELNAASPVRYLLKETGATRNEGYFYVMDPLQNLIYVLEKFNNWGDGRLVYLLDRNGNRLSQTYRAIDSPLPIRTEDGLGRSLDFTYVDASGNILLNRVTDQTGRYIAFTNAWGADDCEFNGVKYPVLRSVQDPEGNTTTFWYQCQCNENYFHRSIAAVEKPSGNRPYSQTVDTMTLDGTAFRRVTSQSDAYGNTTQLTYNSESNQVTETRPDGQIVVYEHFHNDGLPERLTDAAGMDAAFGQTINEQINSITDRIGDTTTLTYHAATGDIATLTNAKGQTTSWTYTAQDQTFTNPANSEEVTFTFYNLTKIDYPDCTNEQFTYDARGNVLTHIDRTGKTWTFTYNDRGQVLTGTNPGGGVTTYTYNGDATVATFTDSDTGVTTVSYDACKRPSRIDYPGGAFVLMAYDNNNRLTAFTDENNRLTTFTYDANGNLVKVTDPLNGETLYGYNLMDRITQITDRLGKASGMTYDTMNRLSRLTDATGVRSNFGYDSRGWINAVTRAGKTWTTAYDDEGVPASRTTPLSRITTETTDKLGLIEKIKDPLNQETVFTRDAMNRVASVTDPRSQITRYAYDAAGRLSGVTLPTSEAAAYVYNDMGLLHQVTDPNNRLWAFSYTPMGRLQTTTDPLSRVTAYTYDTRGRMNQVTYPDTGTLTITRDGAGNVTRRQYSDGPDLQFTYDALNRLTGANDITFTRDAEGRITGTTNPGTSFSAGYNDAGRLKTVAYNNNSFTVTYTYDVGENGTGLLTGVTDSLTGTQITFAFDDDRRLRTVTLPNGEVITYTWDNASRLTRLQSGNHVDLVLGYDSAGQITQTEMAAPLTAQGNLEEQTEALTYDAASQISSAGYTHDDRGRITATPRNALIWDGASRLTGINTTALTYNGLGQVRTRTQGGTTTQYFYNHAGAGAPMVAEFNPDTGQMLRYYVWTPGGRLLYMINTADGNKVYFYHFDQVGSTLALTDADANVTDAWAYDPYGRVLARTGTNPQPFTYAGAWGVRQEGSVGLYQMRARYYDAHIGRFLSPEPVWPQLTEPEKLNPYQYATADPVRFVDPTGLAPDLPSMNLDELKQQAAQFREQFAGVFNEFSRQSNELRKWEGEAQKLKNWPLNETVKWFRDLGDSEEQIFKKIKVLDLKDKEEIRANIARLEALRAAHQKKVRQWVNGNREIISKLLNLMAKRRIEERDRLMDLGFELLKDIRQRSSEERARLRDIPNTIKNLDQAGSRESWLQFILQQDSYGIP